MKYQNVILAAICVAITAGLLFSFKKSERKIVYVKLDHLYNEFLMKKELENSFTSVTKGRQQLLDSLEMELKLIDKRLSAEGEKKDLVNAFTQKREVYFLKKQQFEEDNAAMQEQFTNKIKTQLNQYVSDYGKEKHCDYILGAEGSGAVMYATDADDVTTDVLGYINDKYKGIH